MDRTQLHASFSPFFPRPTAALLHLQMSDRLTQPHCRNRVAINLLFMVVTASSCLAGKAVDVKRCHVMRLALQLLDFEDPSIADVRALLVRASFHPGFLRAAEGRRFLSFLFTLQVAASYAANVSHKAFCNLALVSQLRARTATSRCNAIGVYKLVDVHTKAVTNTADGGFLSLLHRSADPGI